MLLSQLAVKHRSRTEVINKYFFMFDHNSIQSNQVHFLYLLNIYLTPQLELIQIKVNSFRGSNASCVTAAERVNFADASLSSQIFHGVMYKARDRRDILAAMDEFLDQTTVLPPGEWDPTIRIEPPKNVPSQVNRNIYCYYYYILEYSVYF